LYSIFSILLFADRQSIYVAPANGCSFAIAIAIATVTVTETAASPHKLLTNQAALQLCSIGFCVAFFLPNVVPERPESHPRIVLHLFWLFCFGQFGLGRHIRHYGSVVMVICDEHSTENALNSIFE